MDALREVPTIAHAAVTLYFCTLRLRICGIAMDRNKNVRAPFVSRLRDREPLPIIIRTASSGRRSEIVALHDLALAAGGFEVIHGECADLRSYICFPQAAVRIHRARVVFLVMPGIDKYLHFTSSFLLYGDISKRDTSISATSFS